MVFKWRWATIIGYDESMTMRVRVKEKLGTARDGVTRLTVTGKGVSLVILGAMIVGLAIGHTLPGAKATLEHFTIGEKPLPLIIGLFLMLYPIMAGVKYERLHHVFHNRKLVALALVQNWIIGPAVMFFLAMVFLSQDQDYMVGVILVGLARCITAIIVWSDLAEGDRHLCAGLAGLNALFQLIALPLYAYFFITLAPDYFGFEKAVMDVPLGRLVRSECLYFGLPIAAGLVTRLVGLKTVGRERYEEGFVSRIRPVTLIAKAFTIVVIFSLKGGLISEIALDILHIALPLAAYYLLMFVVSWAISMVMRATYEQSTTLSLTAASSNYELAIAISIALWGIGSGQALAATVGPLVEVPMVVLLVHIAWQLKQRFFPHVAETSTGICHTRSPRCSTGSVDPVGR